MGKLKTCQERTSAPGVASNAPMTAASLSGVGPIEESSTVQTRQVARCRHRCRPYLMSAISVHRVVLKRVIRLFALRAYDTAGPCGAMNRIKLGSGAIHHEASRVFREDPAWR